jgi:hypothetical protein
MNQDYLVLCGAMWCQYRQEDAGWELARALRSRDPDQSLLAYAMLQAAEEFHATAGGGRVAGSDVAAVGMTT